MVKLYKQTSGSWQEKTSWNKVWKKVNGVWQTVHENRLWLFRAGGSLYNPAGIYISQRQTQYADVYQTTPIASGSVSSSRVYGSVLAGYGRMTGGGHSSESLYARVYFNSSNKIRLTPYSKLYFDYAITASAPYEAVYTTVIMGASQNTGNVPSLPFITHYASDSVSRRTEYIDISSINEERYIALYIMASTHNVQGTLSVYNIWLE